MASSQVEEIKSKLDISEVIAEYVKLVPAGSNSMKAPCPFHKEKVPSFFVSNDKQIWKCFGCFVPGSLIKTDKYFHKIEDIQIGQRVLTHRGRLMPVVRTLRRKYKGEIIDIGIRKSSEVVSLTADHEVFVIRTKHCRHKTRKTRICQWNCKKCSAKYFLNYKIEKLPARKLSLDDYLLYPINQEINDTKFIDLNKYYDGKRGITGPGPKTIPTKIKVDEKFLKLIGYYIAEGSNHRAYIRFSLGNHEELFAQEIKKLIENIFKIKTAIHRRKNEGRTGIEITACNSKLANIFENLCGKHAENKRIPFELQYLPFKKQKIILEAIFKGDGYKGKMNKCVRDRRYKAITTISMVLAEQLKDVLLRLKIAPALYIAKSKIDKKGVNHKKAYTIFWQDDHILNFSHFFKKERTLYWLSPIKEIKKRQYKGNVYNLTVSKDHSYVAKNFMVGNCGKGGGLFDFVMEIEGVDFPQALRILAKKAGVVLRSTEDYHLTSKRTKILDICREAANFYQWFLLNSSNAQGARDYLNQRKILEKTIKEWQIGYAPNDWRVLYQNLIKKGYKEEDILAAGLIVKSNEGGYYDRFRGRIMFPIADAFGNIVAFTGRILPSLEKEETPKYVNSPETPVFSKSRILFGLDKAKLEIKQRNYTILVEGNVDVISCHEAGTKNTAAVSGTALTLEQIKILKRYSNNLILSFDFDASGQASTKRGIDIALQQEMNLKVLTLPFGKDPDECIKKDKKLWLQAIKDSQPIMEYYFVSAFRNFDASQAREQKRVVKELLPVISKIGDLIEQDFWLKKLSEQAKVSYEILREQLKKTNKNIKTEETETARPVIDQNNLMQERFLGLLIIHPEQIASFYEQLDEDFFAVEKLKKVLREIKKKYGQISLEKEITYTDLKNNIDSEEIKGYIDFLVLAVEKDSLSADKKTIDRELESLFKRIKKSFIGQKIKELEKELSLAEQKKDKKAGQEIFENISKLTQRLKEC